MKGSTLVDSPKEAHGPPPLEALEAFAFRGTQLLQTVDDGAEIEEQILRAIDRGSEEPIVMRVFHQDGISLVRLTLMPEPMTTDAGRVYTAISQARGTLALNEVREARVLIPHQGGRALIMFPYRD